MRVVCARVAHTANGDVRTLHLCVRAGELVGVRELYLVSYGPAAVSVDFRQRQRDGVRYGCILFALRPRTRVARARLRP